MTEQLKGKEKNESEAAQSCLTLCNPMYCSLPGSSVHGIFQAIVLVWTAISFFSGSSWPRDGTQISCIVDRRFTIWATREVQSIDELYLPSGGVLWNEECWHFPLIGEFSFIKSSKDIKCILWGRIRTVPKTALLLAALPFSLHSLPSLISNCLNLSFGTQGRSWRLESIPYKQVIGHKEWFPWSGTQQGLLS